MKLSFTNVSISNIFKNSIFLKEFFVFLLILIIFNDDILFLNSFQIVYTIFQHFLNSI